ncbi:MAG: hypothetical protein LUG91_10840 [Ruminococcus sp.]|nr:hypothetical protein [Ruminococcus sp.]
MNEKIQLLDCTLRDGGLGLEDAFINNIADKGFSQGDLKELASSLQASKIDIVELGSIQLTNDDKTRFAIYQNVEEVSRSIPNNKSKNQMFVGLFRGPDTPIDDIPMWNPSLVDGLRVIIRYSELQKSLDFCTALSRKGYKVFVQPMLTMRYTDEEIDLMIRSANAMKAYALYFVDSYGYMDEEDVKRLYSIYDRGLDKDIRIGFHAHNNMNLAYSNVKTFISYSQRSERNVIIDSCVMGMGQGAGNLQTELIVPYLTDKFDAEYDFESVLRACETIDSYLEHDIWGYSVTRLLPAIHKTAYKYAIAFRNHYKLSFVEINEILETIPEEYRHRYTKENALVLVQKNCTEKTDNL